MRRSATAWRGSRATATCAARGLPEEARSTSSPARRSGGRHPALAQAPREGHRAGASRRRRLLHRADGALPRHPDGAARAVRDPGRLLRRRRADEPARVRRHGHGVQLLPRRRSIGVRLVLSNSEGGLPRCSSSARDGPRRSSGERTPSSSRRSRWPRRWTCSSTATATSSAASGRRPWSASRAGRRRRSTSRSGAVTSKATSGRARDRRRPVQRLRARDLVGADQPQRDAPTHATVPLSSTCRPFELAAAGAAIVSNPHEGIEQWFAPGSEIIVVKDGAQALTAYRELLADPGPRCGDGRAARERVLDEHTYAHRARPRARTRSASRLGVPS